MNAGTMSFRSVLDKPLKDLTEEDISQVTREDCRRFLKQMGMRRPSWNKSQAIQQVISLKALLETTEVTGASFLGKIIVSSSGNVPKLGDLNSVDSVKEASPVAGTFATMDECTMYRKNEAPMSSIPRELSCRASDPNTGPLCPSPRSPHSIDELVGQMTIFYSGKVNVYDAVPLDKAHAVLQIASTAQLSHNDLFTQNGEFWSFPCHIQAASEKNGSVPVSATVYQPLKTGGHATRKALLQRYPEKQKDKARFKIRKHLVYNSSGLEMYSNPQVRMAMSNRQMLRGGKGSQTVPRLPNTLYN